MKGCLAFKTQLLVVAQGGNQEKDTDGRVVLNHTPPPRGRGRMCKGGIQRKEDHHQNNISFTLHIQQIQD